jgi:hypothetical protein
MAHGHNNNMIIMTGFPEYDGDESRDPSWIAAVRGGRRHEYFPMADVLVHLS